MNELAELAGCEKEVRRLEGDLTEMADQLAQAEREVKELRQAVAIALTEINTRRGGWGKGTATLMCRQILNDYPYIQEIPPTARNALRDRILPPLPPGPAKS